MLLISFILKNRPPRRGGLNGLLGPALLLLFASSVAGEEIEPHRAETTAFPEALLVLEGVWDVHEEDRSYRATLDENGDGTYTWQNGRIMTTHYADRRWLGSWHQSGNDREGGFELTMSSDGSRAEGRWWYTRVGRRRNIPPGDWGGSYLWIRLSPDRPTHGPDLTD